MIVVDTSVWSRAWRRAPRKGDPTPAADLLASLVAGNAPLQVPGIVVQELLSGLRTANERRRLEVLLAPFPTLLANREHHLLAATVYNDCRTRGISAAAIDSLIAALTISVDGELLTCDEDFQRISTCCDLRVRLLQDL